VQAKAFKHFMFSAPLVLILAACASGTQGARSSNPFDGAEGLGVASFAESNRLSQLRLLFTGNVNGETEPCGCAVNPKGGLDRRLNFVEKLRKEGGAPLLILDAGNALFPTSRLDGSQLDFVRERARIVLHGSALMGVQVQNVGALDLSAGLTFLKDEASKAKVPLVSASWVDSRGKTVFDERKDLKLENGLEVTITGLSAGREAPIEGLTIAPPVAALNRVMAKMPSSRLLIVLSDLGVAQDREIAKSLDRPVLFVGARDLSSLETPVHEARSLLVQTVLQGQQWGVLDLAWNPNADGWFGLSSASRYSEQWKRVASRRENEKDKEEIEKLKSAEEELLRYAPIKLGTKVVYDHRLVDMTEAYLGKNVLTEAMTKVKSPR